MVSHLTTTILFLKPFIKYFTLKLAEVSILCQTFLLNFYHVVTISNQLLCNMSVVINCKYMFFLQIHHKVQLNRKVIVYKKKGYFQVFISINYVMYTSNHDNVN